MGRLFLAALACAALSSHAQVTAPGSSLDYWERYTGPGMQRVEIGPQGRAIVTKGDPSFSINGGQLQGSRALTLRNPSGNAIDVVARSPIPPARYAALLRKALGFVPILGTGVALYDLANELDFNVQRNQDGELVVAKPDATYCPSAPCYEYKNLNTADPTAPWVRTPQEAAQFAIGKFVNGCGTVQSVSGIGTQAGGHPNYYANYICVGSPTPKGPYGIGSRTRAVDTQPIYTPSTIDELEAAIANESGWPSNSHLPRAVAQAAELTGDRLQPDTVAVTGPSSTPGRQSVTQNPDGTTTTTTTTHQHTYNGGDVSTTNITTVSVYNPVNNTTTVTTTTETPAPVDEQVDECQANPNRLGCQTLTDPGTELVPKETKAVTYALESITWGASASCPQPLPIGEVAGQSRTLDFAPFCDAATRMKPFLLVGAALAAMFIVMAGIRA